MCKDYSLTKAEKRRINALFREPETGSIILMTKDGQIEFYLSDIRDGACGSFKFTWEYDIDKGSNSKNEVYVNVPETKIAYYWDLYFDDNGNLIWKHSNKHVSVYKKVESNELQK